MKRKFRKVFLLTIIVTCFSQVGSSQDYSVVSHRVDSLKEALVGSIGQNRYNILDQLAYNYVTIVDSVALPYATEAFKMSWQFGDSARIVRSGRIKAMAFDGLASYDSTIALSRIVLPIARRNKYLIDMKHLLNILGAAHTFKAEYDKALAYNLESLELRKKYEDTQSIAIALTNTGLVYYKMKNYNNACKYFELSLQLRSSDNGERLPTVDNIHYTNALTNISLCYSYLNNLAKAGEYLARAYRSCEDGPCSDKLLAGIHFSSGLLQFKRGNIKGASKKFLASLFISRKISDQRFQLDNLLALAEISVKDNQLLLAEKYLMQAEPLFESGVPFSLELIKIYKQLFQVNSKLNNYRKVAYYQNKYIQLKDSIYSEEVTINLMKVEADYMERENKAKIDAQAKILALNNDVIGRQRSLNIIIGVVAVLSIALAITLVQNIKQKKRANALLELKVRERTVELETNHTESLKALEKRNQQMKRISSEVNSSMATIKGLCKLSNQDASVVNAGQYISKIEAASDRLQSGIFRTLGIGENVAS